MGDPEFVETLVRRMFEEARRILFGLDAEHPSPQLAAPDLARRWARVFDARNTQYIQTMSPQAQEIWLKAHGCGTDDIEPGAPILALVAHTLGRFADACTAFDAGRIGDEQAQFWIDAAVEDCTCLLLGLENSAD